MRLAVMGALGRTGAATVRTATARGHEVVAVARRPPDDPANVSPGVEWCQADVLDPGSLPDAVAGCHAVISAVGAGTSRQPTTIYSEGTANLVKAMADLRVGRLVLVSAAPVGPRSDHPRFQRAVVLPLLGRFFGATYTDMRRMEADLAAVDDIAWVALRPPRLLDRPATGHYRLGDRPPPGGRSITTGDLAAALLDTLDRPDLARHAVYVSG